MTRFLRTAASALLLGATLASTAARHDFDSLFSDTTLRVDFETTSHGPDRGISAHVESRWNGWAGRRVNLDSLLCRAAVEIVMTDAATGDTIYRDSKNIDPSPEGEAWFAFALVPQPRRAARLSIVDGYAPPGRRPMRADIDIDARSLEAVRTASDASGRLTWLNRATSPKAMTILILAEGYTDAEHDKFLKDAARLDSAFFSHRAYAAAADRINVAALPLVSAESGITRVAENRFVDTALRSGFVSPGIDRLITLTDMRRLADALEGMPAAHVFVLVNTEEYGGAGSWNDYAATSADNPWSLYIAPHEFGHSFANLGDEYEAGYDISYPADREPDEPNLTTLVDFAAKWKDLYDEGLAGLYEGGGYQSIGIWRAYEKCIMRDLNDSQFCPVCTRAIARTIDFYTLFFGA